MFNTHFTSTMNKLNILKILVFTISLSIFLLQMKISLHNLADPPIVTTEERFNIKDIDPPVITMCPQDQIDGDKIKTLGYMDYRNLLKGNTENGTDRNISFWKIFDDALKYSPENFTVNLFSR